MNFKAEVKEVKARKTPSLDMEYRVVLVTNDSKVLELGAIEGDQLVEVEVTQDG